MKGRLLVVSCEWLVVSVQRSLITIYDSLFTIYHLRIYYQKRPERRIAITSQAPRIPAKRNPIIPSSGKPNTS